MPTVAAVSIPMNRVAMTAKNAVIANRLVKLNTTEGEVLHTTAITEEVFGVAQDTVATGLTTSVETGYGAFVKLTASGAITAGDALMPAAADGGKVSTRSGATSVTVGQAIQGAADGAIFTAIYRPAGRSPVPT